jgi:hypothetical protein
MICKLPGLSVVNPVKAVSVTDITRQQLVRNPNSSRQAGQGALEESIGRTQLRQLADMLKLNYPAQ